MGILKQIREKLGIDPEMPDSAALTQALGNLNARINQNRADAAAIEASIPGAVIASIDGAATERRKLERLESEHTALVAAADATRREIAEALAREQAAELEKAWAIAAQFADGVIARANDVDSLVGMMAAALERLRDAITDFEVALPAKARDYDSSLQRHGASIAANAVRARLQNLPVIPHLRTMAEDETAVALRVRPAKQETKPSGEPAAQES